MIRCNVFSMIGMTRVVMKFMKDRANGCKPFHFFFIFLFIFSLNKTHLGIVNISSGSGNHPTPMLTIYSATKAFITQFSRSMHVECWGTGTFVKLLAEWK